MLFALVLPTLLVVSSSQEPLKHFDVPELVMKMGKEMVIEGRSLVVNATFKGFNSQE